MQREIITKEYLETILNYSPSTGIFVWLKNNKQAGYLTHGYRKICILGKKYYEHRLAYLYMVGEWPEFEVDHINNIRNDNKWCNLRLATSEQNSFNKPKQKNSVSKYKGIRWHKKTKKWQVRLYINRKTKYLGYYDCEIEAAKAYNTAALNYHGEFAFLNDL